jgi:hypothetical protein
VAAKGDGGLDGPGYSSRTQGGVDGPDLSWGPTAGPKEGTKDYRTAVWAAGELSKSHDKPFFLAVGFSKPHLPWIP